MRFAPSAEISLQLANFTSLIVVFELAAMRR